MRDVATLRFRSGSRRRPAATAVFLLTLLGTFLGMFWAAPPAAALQDGQEPSSRKVFDRAQAGVSMVMAEFTAEVSVTPPVIDFDRVDAHLQAIVGPGPVSREQALALLVDTIHSDPLTFLVPGTDTASYPVTLSRSGSGFAVSADGHVVTNAHVVAPAAEDLETAMVGRTLTEIRPAIVALWEEERASGLALSDQQIQQLVEAEEQFIAYHAKVEQVTKHITVVPPAGGPDRPQPWQAQVAVAGEEIPGKDVAVLQVEDAGQMPTIRLGDDTTLSVGDRLYAVGYPAAATFNPLLTEESQTEPTLTTGVLSARKTMDAGFTVLQTDATLAQGNSGGPVLDADGKVVGIATFGAVDPATGQPVAGANFVVPVSVVREFLERAGVQPAESAATRTYHQALDAYEQHYYQRALPLFREVEQLDAGYPRIGEFITSSQTAIRQGRDQTPRELFGLPVWLLAAVAAAVILTAALIAAVSVWRVRRVPARHARHPFPAHQHPTAPALTAPRPVPPARDHQLRFPAVTGASALAPAPAAPRPAWPAPAVPVSPGGGVLQTFPTRRPVSAAPTRPCPDCGASLRPGAHFCTRCGHMVRA